MNESQKAKKFIKFFEELKSKEVSIIIDSIYKVEGKNKSLHVEYAKLKDEVKKNTEGKNKFKKDALYWNSKFERFENKNQEEKQVYYDNKLIYQNSDSEINILNERIKNLDKVIDKTSNESNVIHKNVLGFKSNLGVVEYSLNTIKKAQIELVEKIHLEEIKIKSIQD